MKNSLSPSRRLFLSGIGAVTVSGLMPGSLAARETTGRKLVIVILRGAMDGLSALPKLDDPYLQEHRPSLIPENPLPLNDGFALHPSLQTLHGMVQAGDGLMMQAVAGPWRERSHFEAQDLLESGTTTQVTRDGWLNRALQQSAAPISAVSIGPAQPLILQGAAEATSWSPPALPEASEDTTQRLMDLYADDPLLGPALAQAVEVDEIAGGMRMNGRGAQNYAAPLAAAGRLMRAEGGPDVAVVALTGWDTHARQSALLNNRFRALDEGVAALKKELGPAWANSMVVIATEFGRTVRENGAKGTDHGTAGLAIVLGGALSTSGVRGDWPGLAPAQLFENRDLAPANDLRALLKGTLQAQLGIDRRNLDTIVFPNSTDVTPLTI